MSDRHGSVAILTALGFTVILGAAAIGIDYGSATLAHRRAQGAVDIAATLAAASPALAEAAARNSLADNGYAAGAVIRVQPGSYSADGRTAVDARFSTETSAPNAVRVTLQTATPTYFAPALGLGREIAIKVQSTAAMAQFASFTIGSGLAGLDAGVANAVLGAMLGKPLTLSVVDYNALASTRVDAARVLDALAPMLGLEVGNYSEIAVATATVGQLTAALQIASNAVTDGGRAASALAQVVSAARGGATTFQVGSVLNLGDAAALAPALGTSGPLIDVMDALTDVVALSNGRQQISVDLGASIPGLLRTQITLSVGERQQSSGNVRPGSPNATVRTAQVRLLIEATLSLPLGLGNVTLPVYVQAAMSRATLRTLTCPWSPQGQRQVTLDAQPGVAKLAIAEIPKYSVDVASAAPDLTRPATLLRVTPLLIISGRARATIASPYTQALSFSDDDIAQHKVRTVSATNMTQALVPSLVSSLSLDVNGIGLLAPGLLTTVGAALNLAAPSLDSVLDNTLRTIGIRIGKADLTVNGVRCDQAVLVQ
ncbi:TadG family pilus assembly protein [Methylobacterium goesingense]|uniref:Membrane protein n=1 Tax=Methylobacterium goesingense TaxID=243690 RepID=A0ABV2L5R0_9HYPH|nr:TadG family pilus assembly protein [Methylobacterium goesingense]